MIHGLCNLSSKNFVLHCFFKRMMDLYCFVFRNPVKYIQSITYFHECASATYFLPALFRCQLHFQSSWTPVSHHDMTGYSVTEPFQCGDRLCTSESDVSRRQILTYKDGPRTESIKIFIMVVDQTDRQTDILLTEIKVITDLFVIVIREIYVHVYTRMLVC